VSWTRRWHRAASAVLLIAAGAHLTAHWRAFVVGEADDPLHRAAIDAMQGVVLHAGLGATLWTALGFFSLAFAALLALFGTTQWILAREADPRTLRRHALRNALLCVLATGAVALWHPMPQGLVVFGAAGVLFALAAVPRAQDL
jgi:hypothetical protein